jgi:hypothetical protein
MKYEDPPRGETGWGFIRDPCSDRRSGRCVLCVLLPLLVMALVVVVGCREEEKFEANFETFG